MGENETLIEEMLKAEEAQEPGEMAKTKVVYSGDEDVPLPMIGKIESAGYVYVYDTLTGDRSVVNRNMLPVQLRKKRPDGTRVFTLDKPDVVPVRGHLKCLLHPDGPDRVHYNELGLPQCRKSNLVSPFQVRRHMEKRHKMEWAAIEQERQDAEREQERLLRQRLLERAAEPPMVMASEKAQKEK